MSLRNRQLRLIAVLSLILVSLILLVVFGPEPTRDQPTADEFAQWTVPQGNGSYSFPLGEDGRIVGDPSVDWYIIEETEVVPLDPNDPCGDAIIVTTETSCWMPKEPSDGHPYI